MKILKKDLEEIENYLNANDYKFITIQNINNNDSNNYVLKELPNCFLADVNVQFEKKVDSKKNYNMKNKMVFLTNNCPYNDEILAIANSSFIYSRFINDINLENGNKVYYEWVKNSFNRNDKYFITINSNNSIKG